MKNNISIPMLKTEDVVAANRRREDYALSRDQQASEFNRGIAKRLLMQDKNVMKCSKCGKEFEAGPDAGVNAECSVCTQSQ
jgi:hypothetical protein